jgi:uncharacterized protein
MHLSIVIRAGLVGAALAVAALMVLPARADDTPPTLSLSGHGEVSVAPDMAVITSGVVTEADTARAALDANTAAIGAVIAAIKEAGIEARDIQTSDFRVEPRYVYPRKDDEQQAPRIVGYTVTNAVTVRVRDLSKLGAVLDQSVSVGANRIDGISFVVTNSDAHLDAARALAMRDAIRRAEVYAGAAGVRLARILSISESGGYTPVVRKADTMMMRAEAAPPVPVEAGEQTLSIDVNVTWEISQ